jgi:hypothetical protein
MKDLDTALTVMRIMECIGIAAMVAWFILIARSDWPRKADTALRSFLARVSRRS